jgi:hypothetical protein
MRPSSKSARPSTVAGFRSPGGSTRPSPGEGPLEVSLSGDRQGWGDARLLPRRPAQCEGDQALSRGGAEALTRLAPAGHQHGQEPGLQRGDRRAKKRRARSRKSSSTAKPCLEGDHGKLKRLFRPTLGFQSMRTARGDDHGVRGDADVQKGPVPFLDRSRWRQDRGVVHQPPVRTLCLSRWQPGQAITRSPAFFATVPF